MVQPKKRRVVPLVKVRHDGQFRVQRAYHQLWRWAIKEENEIKLDQKEIKE